MADSDHGTAWWRKGGPFFWFTVSMLVGLGIAGFDLHLGFPNCPCVVPGLLALVILAWVGLRLTVFSSRSSSAEADDRQRQQSQAPEADEAKSDEAQLGLDDDPESAAAAAGVVGVESGDGYLTYGALQGGGLSSRFGSGICRDLALVLGQRGFGAPWFRGALLAGICGLIFLVSSPVPGWANWDTKCSSTESFSYKAGIAFDNIILLYYVVFGAHVEHELRTVCFARSASGAPAKLAERAIWTKSVAPFVMHFAVSISTAAVEMKEAGPLLIGLQTFSFLAAAVASALGVHAAVVNTSVPRFKNLQYARLLRTLHGLATAALLVIISIDGVETVILPVEDTFRAVCLFDGIFQTLPVPVDLIFTICGLVVPGFWLFLKDMRHESWTTSNVRLGRFIASLSKFTASFLVISTIVGGIEGMKRLAKNSTDGFFPTLETGFWVRLSFSVARATAGVAVLALVALLAGIDQFLGQSVLGWLFGPGFFSSHKRIHMHKNSAIVLLLCTLGHIASHLVVASRATRPKDPDVYRHGDLVSFLTTTYPSLTGGFILFMFLVAMVLGMKRKIWLHGVAVVLAVFVLLFHGSSRSFGVLPVHAHILGLVCAILVFAFVLGRLLEPPYRILFAQAELEAGASDDRDQDPPQWLREPTMEAQMSAVLTGEKATFLVIRALIESADFTPRAADIAGFCMLQQDDSPTHFHAFSVVETAPSRDFYGHLVEIHIRVRNTAEGELARTKKSKSWWSAGNHQPWTNQLLDSVTRVLRQQQSPNVPGPEPSQLAAAADGLLANQQSAAKVIQTATACNFRGIFRGPLSNAVTFQCQGLETLVLASHGIGVTPMLAILGAFAGGDHEHFFERTKQVTFYWRSKDCPRDYVKYIKAKLARFARAHHAKARSRFPANPQALSIVFHDLEVDGREDLLEWTWKPEHLFSGAASAPSSPAQPAASDAGAEASSRLRDSESSDSLSTPSDYSMSGSGPGSALSGGSRGSALSGSRHARKVAPSELHGELSRLKGGFELLRLEDVGANSQSLAASPPGLARSRPLWSWPGDIRQLVVSVRNHDFPTTRQAAEQSLVLYCGKLGKRRDQYLHSLMVDELRSMGAQAVSEAFE